MKSHRILFAAILLLAPQLRAQDTNRIVIGISGQSRTQPGLLVVAGRGLDSVRTIVQRDLQNSDRFTVVPLPDSSGVRATPMDSASMRGLTGFTYVIELQPALGGVKLMLWDVATRTVKQQAMSVVDANGVGDTRITIHRLSDQVVNWTGGLGIAATRFAFKMKNGSDDGIWRIDSDGANLVRVSPRTRYIWFTPAWHPDGSMISYSEYKDGRKHLYLQKLASGTRTEVTSMAPGDAYGGNFKPDGRSMVFTYAGPSGGSLIATADIVQNCCAHELTHDRRYADNASASYSPNGLHIVYISNRTGAPQIWVMDDDGLNGDEQVPGDADEHGRPLDTYSPAWSPDGTKLVFARDTKGGGRQLFKWSIGGGQPVQLTSFGRNEDPSWAPDSRHIVFKSGRTGREQLWILDLDSGSQRQLNSPGDARYPAWSPILGLNP